MNTWDKSGMFEAYADSLRIQAELDMGLMDTRKKQEWLAAYRRRADRLDGLYAQNKANADALAEAMKEPLTPETAEFLYARLLKDSRKLRRGVPVPMPVLTLLIPYYEEHRDPEKLVRLYGFACNLLASTGSQRGSASARGVYNRKIVAFKDEYKSLRDDQARLELFMAYYAICVAERSDGLISADRSLEYLREMLALWNSRTVRKLDGDNEHISWYVSQTQCDWLGVEEVIDDASPETKEFFCALADRSYTDQLEQNGEEALIHNAVKAASCHAAVLRGEMTWDAALADYFAFYKARLALIREEAASADDLAAEDADFLLDAPLILERWLHNAGDAALRKAVADRVTGDLDGTLPRFFAGVTDPSIASRLSRWCFAWMPYLDRRERKEDWLFNLVARQHFPTCLHSAMVERLALAVTAALLKDRPRLFDPIRSQLPDQEIPEFVSKCALFHDIGKNEIANILNTQVRSLEDSELAEIRKHPDYGCAMLKGDPHLARYADVILGHHRYYNGKGGYPESFDNTSSPYRFVIDLISVCDGLDAATDTLGRNYRRAKTFDQMVEELRQGKNTRYNPDIVSCIQGSKALQAELRDIISDRSRGDTAYAIYDAGKRG